uniref:Methyltransferase type 11 domain-containing protein n=2 Tax=Aegilops tauschii subsp. strangulata TaxID=200361 RepID=A0A453PK90_AEGTS
MRCLVALPAVAVPGRRSHPNLKPRRRSTLVAILGSCRCGRRHLLGASSAAGLLHLVNPPCLAAPAIDPDVMLERVHPARPGWYEKLYATAMDKGMQSYEAEIAQYKSNLFSQLSVAGKNILELGVGTGPNLKYYASADGVNVIGVDPNIYMEEYSRAAATSAGLPSSNFTFRRGVGEALPAEDGSMDAVIGTLVLCSVKDTDMALREIKRVLKPGGLYLFIEHVAAADVYPCAAVHCLISCSFCPLVDGSFLLLVQGALDPLQQFVADGCHLTRKTAENIKEAGFSSLSLNAVRLSSAYIVSPHVYGVAYK